MIAGTYDILVSLGVCLILITLLKPLAVSIGLVDKPDARKHHSGHIPMIGGIALFITLIIALCFHPSHPLDTESISYLAAAGLLVIVGAVDDRYHLNVKLRIFIEAIAASIMVFGAGQWVGNLGNLLGLGDMHMPFVVAYPFTLVAVFGIINAFNMIDGIDGLSGGVALITVSAIMLFTHLTAPMNLVAPVLLGGLLAFLFCNLKLLPFMPKVFLGDAGSKLIGLTVVWLLISVAVGGNQGAEPSSLAPATALYLVGIPLFDMVATTLSRRRRGVSPFEPDRSHIHHILLDAGFGPRKTLVIILTLAIAVALLGILLSRAGVPEVVQFVVFFALYLTYSATTRRRLKLDSPLQSHLKHQYRVR